MRRRLPSMASLHAFDAVARHLSMTRAADELALTESAVSRQIINLEQRLGVLLFDRIRKRISLTRAGAAYWPRVQRSLARLQRDTLEVMNFDIGEVKLEIAALPTVAAQWLIPRLPDFNASYPGVQISIRARSDRFFFSDTAVDGAIYFGNGEWAGARSDYLFDEVLLPTGAPGLLNGKDDLSPEEIMTLRKLHLETRPDAWHLWMDARGLDDNGRRGGPRYGTQSMLVAAAAAGLGAALLPGFLIAEQLANGQLVVLNTRTVTSAGAYYFAMPEKGAETAAPVGEARIALEQFRAWLVAQSERFGSAGS